MHQYDTYTDELAEAIVDYATTRLRLDPVPLDQSRSARELAVEAGETITSAGIGGPAALRLFDTVLSRACVSVDHPRNLSFIPAAPTKAASLFDLVVGASSVYAGSWLDGAGAVFAENQALRWLSDLAGFPARAGGVFVPGGTLGNLAALVAARHRARSRLADRGLSMPRRWRFVCGPGAHSSLDQAARVMDVDVLTVPGRAVARDAGDAACDGNTAGAGRAADDGNAAEREAGDGKGADKLTGVGLAAVLDVLDPAEASGVFAVVATAGTTQFGLVDDIRGVVDVARDRGMWVHVDGAYGLAAIAAPSARHLFDGVADADSFIVDPHKWLFAPFDSCALVYRDPAEARAAHAQKAGYLEVLDFPDAWNPADYAIGLSRRARGLPFWFSLAAHGTDAYRDAVEACLATARSAAEQIRALPYVELVRDVELSIVVFRRLGWAPAAYHHWTEKLLRDGFAFVTPTVHDGETVTRFAVVNPLTTPDDIAAILATMA
jgi:glutamate/tyrosine decarboxylase-like PLP-dependent enzyme